MTAPSEEPPAQEVLAEKNSDAEPTGPSPAEELAAPLARSAVDRLLLDTHVFIWWRATPEKIRAETRDVISRAAIVFVSVASAWETAIKIALGRLTLPDPMEVGVLASGFEKLPITFSHTQLIAGLPHHHRDPFDRMLIAQAISEELTLVTHDSQLRAYRVPILRA